MKARVNSRIPPQIKRSDPLDKQEVFYYNTRAYNVRLTNTGGGHHLCQNSGQGFPD